MASTESKQPQAQQAQGETCATCGKPLAADQRYCLNCGTRRADSRVDFEKHLFGADASSPNGLARAPAQGRGWNPLAAAALLGLLGIMLLVGILIGKDENDEPASTTPPAQTSPAATTPSATPAPAPTPTATTPATPTAPTAPTGKVPASPTPVTPGGGAESEPGVNPNSKVPAP